MDYDNTCQQILSATKQVVVSSSKLPAPGTEYSLNLSVGAIRNNLADKRQKVLSLTDDILRFLNLKISLASSVDVNKWQDDADVEDMLDVLIDANDHNFEQIGDNLDLAAGVKKDTSDLVVVNVARNKLKKFGSPTSKSSSALKATKQIENSDDKSSDVFRLLAAKVVERPQLKFPDKIDNGNGIFIPKIKRKPNALKKLDESLVRLEEGDGGYMNPYSFELQSFVVKDEFVKANPQTCAKIEETPLLMVESELQFAQFLEEIASASEIAIDLEHHSYRTFQGFTCLMQISTRSKDYIVDALALRGQMERLLPIFTNPGVLKVFHGADSDIAWLQRDFGLYVVNMFDSHKAAKALGFPKLSLSYLLDRYLQIDLDKRFQLADWRIRPLPEELINYARSDTHYLLYICDLLKSDLIEKAKYEGSNDIYCLVRSVFDDSSTVCSMRYEKPIFTKESYLELYERSRKVFNSQQLMALRLLYEWRDKMARREDESTGYVLPNHMLLQMAELLPKEPTGVLACCQPIPPIVKQNVHEMHGLIIRARRQPLTQVENPAVAAAKAQFASQIKLSPELMALSCPLDPNTEIPDSSEHEFNVEIEPKPRHKEFSSFIDLLVPVEQEVSSQNSVLKKTLSLFSDYVVSSGNLIQVDRKLTLVEEKAEVVENVTPSPKKRKSSAPKSAPNLHLAPINSGTPAKNTRKSESKSAESTPLVTPKTKAKRGKRKPKFVEELVVISDDELASPKKRGKRNQGGGSGGKTAKRRDQHERKARQMQTFASTSTRGKKGGK